MIPHTCPTCRGERVVILTIPIGAIAQIRQCPTCKGEGVVWQTELKDITTHKDGDALRKSSAGESK